MRAQPRLVYQPHFFQKLLDLKPSTANALEFCVGTLAEMTEGDVYEAVDAYSRQGKIAYVSMVRPEIGAKLKAELREVMENE